MTVPYDPYRTDWRTQAAAGDPSRQPPDQQSLFFWLTWAASSIAGAAYSGRGQDAGALARRVSNVLAQATPMEMIELALERSEYMRPPRSDDTAKAGRYASLAITALEEARNWERCRAES